MMMTLPTTTILGLRRTPRIGPSTAPCRPCDRPRPDPRPRRLADLAAAETETEQRARREELFEVLCKTGKETEDGEPQDRDLKSSDTADPIGEVTAEPAADSRHRSEEHTSELQS